VAQLREYAIEAPDGSLAKRLVGQVANAPAMSVTWHEAIGFCLWLSSRWHDSSWLRATWVVTLPSEAEWEKSARGGVAIPARSLGSARHELPLSPELTPNLLPCRRFPWGDEADPNRASYDRDFSSGPSTVGCFPGGVSPYGCEELSGNVWEWTRSLWKPYPYVPEDGREDLQVSGRSLRVMRGGSFFLGYRPIRCAARLWHFPVYRYVDLGFRVVLSPFRSDL